MTKSQPTPPCNCCEGTCDCEYGCNHPHDIQPTPQETDNGFCGKCHYSTDIKGQNLCEKLGCGKAQETMEKVRELKKAKCSCVIEYEMCEECEEKYLIFPEIAQLCESQAKRIEELEKERIDPFKINDENVSAFDKLIARNQKLRKDAGVMWEALEFYANLCSNLQIGDKHDYIEDVAKNSLSQVSQYPSES